MKRYLVTGGAGFIGGEIVRRLVALGHSVDVLDLPGKIAGAPRLSGANYIAGDIGSAGTFRELRGFYDAVFHLAAQTSARVSHEEPTREVDTNVRGTMLLLEWCAQNQIERFLFASSMQVYGNVSLENLPMSETQALVPVSYYGVSKIAAENCLRIHSNMGLKTTVFRMFNVYGPGQDLLNKKQGIVSIYLAFALGGKPIDVTGSLQRVRDLVYIDDIVNAWLVALDNPVSFGRTYNVGSGNRITVRQLIDRILDALGHDKASYPVNELPGHVGDQFGVQAGTSLITRELGWRPCTNLEEGLGRMVAWARNSDGNR